MNSKDDQQQFQAVVDCPHADRCGGCPVIGLSYADQLSLKHGRVVQSVARYTDLSVLHTHEVSPANPITAYRTRAKLIVAPGPKLGLFAKGGGHQVIDIPDCRVLSDPLAELATTLRKRFAADEQDGGVLAPFDPLGNGMVRAVDLREIAGENGMQTILTIVVERSRSIGHDAALKAAGEALMAEVPTLAGVAVNYHDGISPQVLGAETRVVAGVAQIADNIGVSSHLASYGSFVQAHRSQAARVHELLGEWLTPEGAERAPKLLDVYGGSGAIALSLARRGAAVHVIESFPPAIDKLVHYSRETGLPVTAESADAAAALRKLSQRGVRFDAIVANPPRRGISPLAREWITRLDAKAIVYVSCEPETLARDLDHFARLGYVGEALQPFDMIPLTDEVETVVLLKKGPMPAPRIVFEDAELLMVEKGPHEPTLPLSDYQTSVLGRLMDQGARVGVDDHDRLIPLITHDAGTSGLVVFAKGLAFAEKWARIFSSPTTRQVYLVGARGITPGKAAITRELKDDGRILPARTRYRRLAVLSGHSVLRVIPEQSHLHQIRRHLAAVGHPILGDERYGHAPSNRFFEERHGLDRTFLHCVRIEFEHPEQGHSIIEAPLSGDLRAVLERAGGPGTLKFLDNKAALGGSSLGSSLLPPLETTLVPNVRTGDH